MSVSRTTGQVAQYICYRPYICMYCNAFIATDSDGGGGGGGGVDGEKNTKPQYN